MSELESRNLIYDWNLKGTPELKLPHQFSFVDETLARTSMHETGTTGHAEILRCLAAVGLLSVNVPHGLSQLAFTLGLKPAVSIRPGSSGQVFGYRQDVEVRIHQSLSSLMMTADGVSAAAEQQRLIDTVRQALDQGMQAVWVAEDATRTSPSVLGAVLVKLAEAGLQRVALEDSVGCATPAGVQRLLSFVRSQAPGLRIDWGGRNDRGLAIVNALMALSSGADRVCGTILGLGEGAGLIALDTLMTNVALMERPTGDLMALKTLCQTVARLCQVQVPVNYPVFGSDAFRTATGVHAAAIVKARKKGDVWLADRVYSGIPAGLFGLSQVVDIGPMSGLSNVSCWLEDRGLTYTQDDVTRILQRAKQSNRTLTEEEVREVISR